MSVDSRAVVLRLRREGLTYAAIGRATGLDRSAVRRMCLRHFGSIDPCAQVALEREIAAVREEAGSAPLYRYWRTP